jgi:hypothetical protein
VHRDVSPSNILVSFDGAVKLVDFGIARAETNKTAQITRTGQLKGKIPYMSPEQCRAKQLDGRADLFSLGSVFYELTTGQRPFDGKGDFDTLERIVHGTMVPPSALVPAYPKSLEAVVLRMLANKRADRYQTAESLLVDLERLSQAEGMFASAFAVGKYMRELFPEEANRIPTLDDDDGVDAGLDATTTQHRGSEDIIIDIADPNPSAGSTTHRYPRAQASNLFALEVPTAEVGPPQMPAEDDSGFKVVFRPPTSSTPTGTPMPDSRASTQHEYSFLDEEGSTTSGFRGEITHADSFPHFDPIAARGYEMLSAIDPTLEDRELISLTMMGELLKRAAIYSDDGDLENAVIAIDLILSADRTTPGILDLLAKNFPFMTAVYEEYLGDRSRMPAITQQVDEIADVPLDRRAQYVLSLLDGNMSAAELIERADMPIVEAYRHLSLLILRRVVVLV